jgi:hypothetical protein
MKNIGLLVESVNLSQKGMLLDFEVSQLAKSRQDLIIIVFYQFANVAMKIPSFPMMQNLQAWCYDGHFIAFDFSSAQSMIPLNNSGRKLYYPLEFDWLERPDSAKTYMDVYRNSKIDLIARSQSHFEVLSKVWKKPVAIIEDLDHEQLANVIDRHCV